MLKGGRRENIQNVENWSLCIKKKQQPKQRKSAQAVTPGQPCRGTRRLQLPSPSRGSCPTAGAWLGGKIHNFLLPGTAGARARPHLGHRDREGDGDELRGGNGIWERWERRGARRARKKEVLAWEEQGWPQKGQMAWSEWLQWLGAGDSSEQHQELPQPLLRGEQTPPGAPGLPAARNSAHFTSQKPWARGTAAEGSGSGARGLQRSPSPKGRA